VHRAEEDYIKSIYELTVEKQRELIKVSELSLFLELADQTVNETVKKLESKGLLNFMPYKGVTLTKKGHREAIRLIRTHRIWEVFLTEKLGYNWGDVHEEAERLEHATSERLLNRLDEYLGSPQQCGHGNPIPLPSGKSEPVSTTSMFSLEAGDLFKIVRVQDNQNLLAYLDKQGIGINQHYVVKSKDIFGEIMEISGEKVHHLSKQVACMIFVDIK